MTEPLLQYFRSSLPEELVTSLTTQLEYLEDANFEAALQNPLAKELLGTTTAKEEAFDGSRSWSDYIFDRLEAILAKRNRSGTEDVKETSDFKAHIFFTIALAAIGVFIQSSVTGPPLPFSSASSLFSNNLAEDSKALGEIRRGLIDSLRIDGEAAYRLTPNIEMLSLADAILTCPPVLKKVQAARWARMRLNFLHQRILSEISPTLEEDIYEGLDAVRDAITQTPSEVRSKIYVPFLLEAATIHTHHGNDKLARAALDEAIGKRNFEFAITGRLGKRTKWQERDITQLVVLAKSAEDAATDAIVNGDDSKISANEQHPVKLDLNDDTLLEKISFTKTAPGLQVQDEENLTASLRTLDLENQPLLQPLDSIILLAVAASITNTNPADGLTREETAPYPARVLEGGSSNWQVYTQALLLRSRIEGYKSRTVERGLLQLQALVDQVIADTATSDAPAPATFLPKAKESESAPANQRLLHVFALCSPTRWELEAELAARWVSLGGLRSALDIYERLEMWAEVALCYAATDKDDTAKRIINKQLFHSTDSNDDSNDEDTETWTGAPRDPPPADAPRLYCILGDINKDPSQYEKAWEISGQRYARAQRSLGRHHYTLKDYSAAATAYSKSLKVKQLDHATWFALGCCFLELGSYREAVEAFSRTVQLDHDDGEAWSNMAAALLNLRADEEPAVNLSGGDGPTEHANTASTADKETKPSTPPTQPSDPQKNTRDALRALKQAARLKRDNHRIWDNLLTVAASLDPPSWSDILLAQSRLIELRGATDGEKCIDVVIVSGLVNHVISSYPSSEHGRPGLPKMVTQLVESKIVPLITSLAALWKLVGKLALWRGKWGSALEAQEKAWRVVSGQPGWEYGSEKGWDEVVEATVELVGAYESLGPRERTEGLAAGSGEMVAKDWRFKGKSAIRGIMGRGKGSWEGTKGWERLKESLEGLKV